MKVPADDLPLPPGWDESARLAALDAFGVLDTPRERDFNDIAALAAAALDAPIAVVNFIASGRQWFKAEIGIGQRELPLEVSICRHALLQPGVFVVPDLTVDPRFDCNPLVTPDSGLRFYAGALLETADGLPLGTLCVLDHKVRPGGLSDTQRLTLTVLARQVMAQLELRRAARIHEDRASQLESLHRERLASSDRLARSEERYAALFSALDTGVCLIEIEFDDQDAAVDYRYIEVNAAFTTQTGLKDVAGKRRRDILPTAEQGWLDLYGAVALTGQPARVENTSASMDGRWFDVQAFRVGDPQDRRVAVLFNDITARRLAEEAVKSSEAFLRLVINSSSEAFYAIEPDGTTTLCNDAFLAMIGLQSRDQVIGRKLHDAIHHSHPDGSHYPVGDCPIYQAAATGTSAFVDHEVFFRADGTAFPVEYRAEPIIVDGKHQGAICTFRDITERRAAEMALRQSEATLRELNETLERKVEERTRERDRAWKNSRDLQLVMDKQGIIRAVNEAWIKILGWSEAELVGESVANFIHAEDRPASDRAMALTTVGPSPAFENRYRHKRGGYRWFSWVAAPEDALIYASGRHITDEKLAAEELAAMQDQLRQAQKMEAVGQLTGGVAHDFNNLLTIIRSSVDFLKRPDLQEERRRRYIAAISDTVDRASKLTSQLLAFARRQPLKPQVFDAGLKVTEIVELMRPLVGGRIKIVVKGSSSASFVEADVGQFETALVNLAVNARDAMGGEGRLSIKVQTVSAIPALRAHPRRPGAFVAIAVRDYGAGIAADKLEAIFEPFFTTKEVGKGTGLGLSQVFGFAKQSHGEISVTSVVGEGSTFTLFLPSVSPDRAARLVETAPVAAQTSGEGVCVLVVEDNEAVGQFSTEMLHDLGYRTAWASSAAEALRILGEDASGFDLVFSDVIMPGMNGVEFARIVRDRFQALPVVLTSGYSEVLATEGHDGFELIQKPYSVDALSQALQVALGSSAAKADRID